MKKRWLSVLVVLVLLASPVLAEEAADGSAAENAAAADNAPALTSAEMIGRVLDALGDEQYRKPMNTWRAARPSRKGIREMPGWASRSCWLTLGATSPRMAR